MSYESITCQRDVHIMCVVYIERVVSTYGVWHLHILRAMLLATNSVLCTYNVCLGSEIERVVSTYGVWHLHISCVFCIERVASTHSVCYLHITCFLC